MKLKRPEGMKGLDVSALSEQHHQKDDYKSRLLLEARLRWEEFQDDQALDMYAEVATLEEELMQECRDVGVGPKYFIHAFSAAHCWIKAADFYRARHLCNMILAQPDLTPPLREKAEELLQGVREGQQASWEKLNPKLAA